MYQRASSITAITFTSLVASAQPPIDKAPPTTEIPPSVPASSVSKPVDLSKAAIPSRPISLPITDVHDSANVLMRDGNMMRISQNGDEVIFEKTSSGYGAASIEIRLKVGGIGVTEVKGNVYKVISVLEALAYFDNDWRKIIEPLRTQNAAGITTVNSEMLQRFLEPIVTPIPEAKQTRATDPVDLRHDPASDPLDLLTWRVSDFSIDRRWFLAKMFDRYTTQPVYIRIPVDGDVLLRVQEVNGRIVFSKTSSGYGVTGMKGDIAGFGGGAETTVANVYFEISPKEALSYVSGGAAEILSAVRRQHHCLDQSVSPTLVEDVLRAVQPTLPVTPKKLLPATTGSPVTDPESKPATPSLKPKE